MKVLRGPHRDWDVGVDATAVTVGVYDGVHRGHLAVIDALSAPADGLPRAVVTFEQHPATLLAPDRVPPLLTDPDQKVEALEAAGVDVLAMLPFDASVASMSAETFIREVLVEAMAASLVVVGKDFRFGYRRLGDTALLEKLGVVLGYDAVGLELHADSGEAVSSSRIRSLIANGDLRLAGVLLGRPFALRGVVVPGDARGRTIGVPTANVAIDPAMARPANGVYAVTGTVDGLAIAESRMSVSGLRSAVRVMSSSKRTCWTSLPTCTDPPSKSGSSTGFATRSASMEPTSWSPRSTTTSIERGPCSRRRATLLLDVEARFRPGDDAACEVVHIIESGLLDQCLDDARRTVSGTARDHDHPVAREIGVPIVDGGHRSQLGVRDACLIPFVLFANVDEQRAGVEQGSDVFGVDGWHAR